MGESDSVSVRAKETVRCFEFERKGFLENLREEIELGVW